MITVQELTKNGSYMRAASVIVASLMCCGLVCAAQDPGRESLISRIEVQYTYSTVFGADSPFIGEMLRDARSSNPNIDEAMWKEVQIDVAAALTSVLTAKGGALDLFLRGGLDPLSTDELKRLSSLLSDPVYKKFQGSMNSAANQKQMVQSIMASSLSMMAAVNGVLTKHGLTVPH